MGAAAHIELPRNDSGEANATRWTDVAIATLALARGPADVDQWRHDNRRYLARLQKAHPAQYQRIEDAIAGLLRRVDL
jgi:hypothetical protein